MIQFTTLETENFTWLFIESRRNAPDRADLLRLELPEIAGRKGLIISHGKLPVWAGVGIAVSHYRNRCQWQAIYDSALKGAIVQFSSAEDVLIGDFLPVRLPCLVCDREGKATLLRAGAMYPYCQQSGHQNYAPERQAYRLKS